MHKPVAAAVTLLLLAAGCDDAKKTDAAASASAAPTTTAPKKKAPEPVEKPKALDVEALKKKIGCVKRADGPCGVLEDFKECIPFKGVTASGEGRWLGEGYKMKGKSFLPEFTIVYSKRVGTADVAPGQLPAKMAFEKIPDTRGAEQNHAKKAIRAFRRGDVARPVNQAVKYVKELQLQGTDYLVQADGNQVYVQRTGGAYLCAKKDQRLLLVKRGTQGSASADGVYATLWPVTW